MIVPTLFALGYLKRTSMLEQQEGKVSNPSNTVYRSGGGTCYAKEKLYLYTWVLHFAEMRTSPKIM